MWLSTGNFNVWNKSAIELYLVSRKTTKNPIALLVVRSSGVMGDKQSDT